MKKCEYMKKVYIKPVSTVVAFCDETTFLASSPAVKPGGGGSGSVTITPPDEDDEDTDLTGTRKFSENNLWE